MPFIGQSPVTGAYHKLDSITTSATATYNLLLNGGAYYPASANNLLVSLNGVMQAPQDSFTVSGSQITFASALTSSDVIDFIMALGDVLNIGTPSDGTVNTSQLANSAVTDAKMASTLDLSGKTVTYGLSDGDMPAGTVIGWQSFSVPSISTTSSSFQYSVASESYTPKQTNSRIILLWDLAGWSDVDSDANGYNIAGIAYDYSTDGGSSWVTGAEGNTGGRGGNGVGGRFTHSLLNSSWSSIKVRGGLKNRDAGSRTVFLRSDLGGSNRVTLLEIVS